MKKIISLVICAAIGLLSLSGCGSKEKDGKLHIVATIFPEYDWTMQIIGDNPGNADVSMLLDNGVDLHSYQPSMDDIMKISECDVFIYVGGESDKWVRDALSQAKNKDMIVIDLMDVLKDRLKEEETVEGMQGHDDDGHDDETENDEHVWLSLRNASAACDAIADALSKADSKNADTYKKNSESYKKKLSQLDEEYKAAASSSKTKTILVGDRFPFRYLVDDYGLDYYAAFSGCSAETDASFDTIIFLAKKSDELGLKYILKTETSDSSVVETIRDNTKTKDQKILTLDSMQSTTSSDIRGGTSYLSVMEKNCEVLKQVLENK